MKRRSFVVRVWIDSAGQFQGQISDPFSDWRRPFQSKRDLWKQLQSLADKPTPSIADSSQEKEKYDVYG